jgi:hypothetical protein
MSPLDGEFNLAFTAADSYRDGHSWQQSYSRLTFAVGDRGERIQASDPLDCAGGLPNGLHANRVAADSRLIAICRMKQSQSR